MWVAVPPTCLCACLRAARKQVSARRQVNIPYFLHTAYRDVTHVSLKRNLKIVVLVDERNKDKKKYTILFSTDTELDAKTLVRYYKARFQIEFIFRDAKQFTGLPVCLLACLRADTHRQAQAGATVKPEIKPDWISTSMRL